MHEVNRSFIPDDQEELVQVDFPGRPLIAPIRRHGHVLLMIIQYDMSYNPTVSVVDACPWYLEKQEREEIFGTAVAILRRSNWRRSPPHNKPLGPVKPGVEQWITSATKSPILSADTGYYAIFNAWTLMLGMEINQKFEPPPRFEDEARKITNLACAGCADRELVIHYLVTIGFAKDPGGDDAHTLRKFEKSFVFSAGDPPNWLQLRAEAKLSPKSILDGARVILPPGSWYKRDFPADGWDFAQRLKYEGPWPPEGFVENHTMDEHGYVNPPKEDEQRHNPVVEHERSYGPVVEHQDDDQPHGPVVKLQDDESISRWLEAFKLQIAAINAQVEDMFTERAMKRVRILEAMKLEYNRKGGAQSGAPEPKRKDVPKQFDPSIDVPPVEDRLEGEIVHQGIASVVEAIMAHQSKQDPLKAGGMALASTHYHIFAAGISGQHWGKVARPRRCWLMPVSISDLLALKMKRRRKQVSTRTQDLEQKEVSGSGGHFILAVVQEIQS